MTPTPMWGPSGGVAFKPIIFYSVNQQVVMAGMVAIRPVNRLSGHAGYWCGQTPVARLARKPREHAKNRSIYVPGNPLTRIDGANLAGGRCADHQ